MADPQAFLGSLLSDRYRILEVIGRGGTAIVYKAEDEKHRRLVAIKVFRGDLKLFGGPDRFAREIAILATLQHPHILPLLDSGTAGDQLYYVMPFVQGESLRDRLTIAGRLPLQEGLRLLVEVCDALRYAHEFGIIHRDVKPENILLSGRHAQVADFGVARAAAMVAADGGQTTAGIAVGTPTYMAPEQAAADPSIDHRADIYALGIVAYEMFAGQPPFHGEGPANILAAHVTVAPKPLEEIRPDLPPGLCRTLMRGLAKRPEDRWQTTGRLAQELEPYMLPSGAVTPVNTAAIPLPTRWLRPRMVAAALAVVALGAALGYAIWPRVPTLTLGTPKRLGVAVERELDPTLGPDRRLIAYSAGRNGTLQIMVSQLEGGDPIAIAKDVAGNQRNPTWSNDGSKVVFQSGGSIYQAPALGGRAEVLVEGNPTEPAENFAWAPDGRSFGFTQGGEIRVRSTSGEGNSRSLVRDGMAHSLSFSPDGKRLAYVSGNRDFAWGETLLGNLAPSVIRVVPVAGGTPVNVTDGKSLAMSPAWWSDRAILFVGSQGSLRDLFLQPVSSSGKPNAPQTRLTTGFNAHSIRVSSDRTRLSVATLEQVSNVWAVPLPAKGSVSIQTAEPVTVGNQIVEDMDVLTGSGWLLFDSNQNGNQDIYIQSLRSGRTTQITRDPSDEFGPTWSPNGKEAAFYSVRDGVRHIFVMRATGRGIQQVTNDSLQDHQPHWSPDGQRLVFYRRDGLGRDRIFLTDRKPDSSWTTPRLLTEEVGTGATWSPDGRWIAFSDPEGRIRLISVEGGTSRVIATPEQAGGAFLKRPQWLPEEPILLARAERPGGMGGIWRIPIDGGQPTELIRFDDPNRPAYRDDFGTDGERVYFTISLFDAAMWVIPLGGGEAGRRRGGE
jgi:Tol biopolymer transport system component